MGYTNDDLHSQLKRLNARSSASLFRGMLVLRICGTMGEVAWWFAFEDYESRTKGHRRGSLTRLQG